METKNSKLFTAALILLVALFVLTASIAVPILFRPFYYWQIGPLNLEAQTGMTRAEITQAYNEMIRYCTGLSSTFSTGVLPWSEVGYTHFTDVRGLFLLDLWVMGITGILLVIWLLIRKRMSLQPHRPFGRSPLFWTGSGLLTVFVLISGLAALDFSKAFVIFHSIFFPGKTNWLFDPRQDAIITILPEVFFRNCAICIVAVLMLSCILLMVAGRRKKA